MATVIWQGDAVDIAQISTVTLGGAWLANDTITLTISDKQLTLTIGVTVDIPTILDNLVIMVSGTGDFDTDYSSNALGNAVGEFAELTATEDGSTVLTLTANTAGTPYTLTSSRVTASTGTIADATTTANGSKNDWNNVDNWDTGVVPVNGDAVIFQNNDVSVKFGLNQSAVTLASLTTRQSYTGEIGLPETNAEGSISYDEYRGTFLQIATAIVEQGQGDGTGSGRIKIDSGTTSPVAITVTNTGSAVDTDLGAFIWKGTGANVDFVIREGSVGLGVLEADTAVIDQLDIVDATVIHFQGTVANIFINGTGSLDITGDITGGLTLKGAGTADVRGLIPGAGTGFVLEQGTINVSSPTDVLITLTIFGGAIADFSKALGVITVTNEVSLHPGGSLLDPLGNMVFTNDIKIIGGSLSEVTLDLGKDRVVGMT